MPEFGAALAQLALLSSLPCPCNPFPGWKARASAAVVREAAGIGSEPDWHGLLSLATPTLSSHLLFSPWGREFT